MRKIIILLSILFCVNADAQNVILSSADNAFIVNGQYYPLNSVALSTTDNDTTLAGMFTFGKTIATLRAVSYFKRSNGVSFINRKALINYYDSVAINSNGGGISMAIGSPVAGGIENYYLTIAAGGILSQASNGGGSSTPVYLIPGSNVTIDSTIEDAGKFYTVSAAGGGCLESCNPDDNVTIGMGGKNLIFENFNQFKASNAGGGSVTIDAGSINIAPSDQTILLFPTGQCALFVGGSIVASADSAAQTASYGYGDTKATFNNDARTITVAPGPGGSIFLNAPNASITASTLIMINIPEYADDAAAISDGKAEGVVYKTTTLGSTYLKIVPAH